MNVKTKKQRVPRTRGSGSHTESSFWLMIRAALRRRTMMWKPRVEVLTDARRPNESDNKRLKWEYLCAECQKYHPRDAVEVDHIEGVGTLTCAADLELFVERLFCEKDKLRVVCIACHDKKTYKTKENDSTN